MDAIRAGEIIVNLALQGLGPVLQAIMCVITEMGSQIFFFLLIPAIYWSVDALAGLRVGCMLLLSGSLNHTLKALFKGPRPYWISDNVTAVVQESSFGMPSGHAMNSASVFGWLAVESKKRWMTSVCLAIIFLIGFSRLVLGVHFLSDVLVGWLLGGALVLAFSLLYPKVSDRVGRLSWQAQAALAFGTSLLMITFSWIARAIPAGWSMPADWLARAGDIDPLSLDGVLTTSGLWLGMLAGFAALRHKKGILQSGNGEGKRVLRYLVGVIGLFVLYAGLGSLFPKDAGLWSAVLRYLRYALIGLWISYLSPLLFEKLKIGEFQAETK